MSRPPDDHGIEHEPHLRPGGFTPDPSEAKAAVPRARGDDVEHTVWDEPALDSRLSGQTPADALTYERWLVARHAATSPAKTWAVTFGIILAAGRATMEMGRSMFLPAALGRVNATTQTPIVALVVNMLIGIAAILSGRTGDIITLAAFGAVVLYVISMMSLFVLRKAEPELERPFRAVCFPVFPALALGIAAVSFVAMAWFNPVIGGIFVGILVLGSGYFLSTRRGA